MSQSVFYQQHISEANPHYYKWLSQQPKPTPYTKTDKKDKILNNFLIQNDNYNTEHHDEEKLKEQLKVNDKILYFSKTLKQWTKAHIINIEDQPDGPKKLTIKYKINEYIGLSKKKSTSTCINVIHHHPAPNLIGIMTKSHGKAWELFNKIKPYHNAIIYNHSSITPNFVSELINKINHRQINIVIFPDTKQLRISKQLTAQFDYVIKYTDKTHNQSYYIYRTILKPSGKLIKFASFALDRKYSLQYIENSITLNNTFINQYINNLNKFMKLQIPTEIIHLITIQTQDNLVNIFNRSDIIIKSNSYQH